MSNPIHLPLKMIAETVLRRGFDVGRWSPDEIPPMASHVEVHRLMMHLLPQQTDVPLGVIVGKYCPPFEFGLPSRIARHCPTLRESVERYIYFQTLAAPGCIWLEPHEDREDTEVLVAPTPPMNPEIAQSHPFFCIFPMTFAVANLRRLSADESLKVEAVDVMAAADEWTAQYEEFFGGPVRFNADQNRCYFSSQTLDAPVQGADPKVVPYLEKLAFKEFQQFGHRPGLTRDFEKLVRTRLEEGFLNDAYGLPDLAQALTMSERTLQRRLKEEGLSYRTLVDEVRETLALELLRCPDHTLQGIAHKLGYNHLASFNRAFKRWTGRSPGEFREILGQS